MENYKSWHDFKIKNNNYVISEIICFFDETNVTFPWDPTLEQWDGIHHLLIVL